MKNFPEDPTTMYRITVDIKAWKASNPANQNRTGYVAQWKYSKPIYTFSKTQMHMIRSIYGAYATVHEASLQGLEWNERPRPTNQT